MSEIIKGIGCVCSEKYPGDGYYCSITGDRCYFGTPSQNSCADQYGEVERTDAAK